MNKPKILFYDIETAPILGHVWGLWQNDVGLNQIESDWYILSFAAKWAGKKEVIYHDQSKVKNIEDDSKLLKKLWKLLNEADIVVGHNSNSFDNKKVNARFALMGMKPPSSYRTIDTKLVAKRHFKFTSNKLAYLTDKLCTKYKKLNHAKFSGFSLWKECLAGNKKAWAEMEKYNKYDVLSLEELYEKLIPWDKSINFSVYNDGSSVCSCGSTHFQKNGYYYTKTGKFQRHRCVDCGSEFKEGKNMLIRDKTNGMLRK
jgi:uncharacterized protein YprB with RNaseH-like and TPR domain